MKRRRHDCSAPAAALPTARCTEVEHVVRTDTTERQALGNLEKLTTAAIVPVTSISILCTTVGQTAAGQTSTTN